jgi:hypothetical protein
MAPTGRAAVDAEHRRVRRVPAVTVAADRWANPAVHSSNLRTRVSSARTVRPSGVVEAIQPAALLPDTHAHFLGENPQHVYSVRFDSRELWPPGPGTDP